MLHDLEWRWMGTTADDEDDDYSYYLANFFFFVIHVDVAETGHFSSPCFCGDVGAIKTQKRTTTFLLPLCQCDNYGAFKFLSQWKGKLVNVLTRWIWNGESQKQLRNNTLGCHISPWSKPYHYQTRWRALENRSNRINLCSIRVSKSFHLFNFLLSGLLLQHWPKEQCVPHPRGLSFTVRSPPTSSDWTVLKDYEGVFLCFMLRCAAAEMATLHRCWRLSGLVRSPHKMLEPNSFFQSDGGLSFLQD